MIPMWKNLLQLFREDNLYTQALRESNTMLELDLTIFDASVRALRQSDGSEIDVDIDRIDREINRYERDVRRKVLTHLTINAAGSGSGGGPGSASADLVSGLVLVSVVIDIERIGDYAKNIHDLARHHPRRLHGGPLEAEVATIETKVSQLFRATVEAFRTSDVEASRAVMTGYKDEVSAICEDVIERLVGGRVDELTASQAAAIALYVRHLKRIGAHSRNIMTSVVNPFHRIGYREKGGEKGGEEGD